MLSGCSSRMRKTVPLSRVVPVSRSPSSAAPVLSTGKPWLVHTTQAVAPGRAERSFCDTSSIVATARPWLSCPVTTRRTRKAIEMLPFLTSTEVPSPCPLPHWGRGLRRVGEAQPSLTRIPGSSPRRVRGCAPLLRGVDGALLFELRGLLRGGLGLGGDRSQFAVALGGDLAHMGDDAAGAGRNQPSDDDVLLEPGQRIDPARHRGLGENA